MEYLSLMRVKYFRIFVLYGTNIIFFLEKFVNTFFLFKVHWPGHYFCHISGHKMCQSFSEDLYSVSLHCCFNPKENSSVFSSLSIAVGLLKDADPLPSICLTFRCSDCSLCLSRPGSVEVDKSIKNYFFLLPSPNKSLPSMAFAQVC